MILTWEEGKNGVVVKEAANPCIVVLAFLLCVFIESLAFVYVSRDIDISMNVECDPRKHLILNEALNKTNNIDHVYAVDFIYLGDFKSSLVYSDKMTLHKRNFVKIAGFFNKARCYYFLGETENLKFCVEQYKNILYNSKISDKRKINYQKMENILDLLIALSEKDSEKILLYRNIEAWNKSKATEGFVMFLKGVIAYEIGDKLEAVYNFMHVKKNCEKTVLCQMANEYLSVLG